MSKILYINDNNNNKNYKYNIEEDTIIYHFSINSTCSIEINLVAQDVTLNYYYNNINYDDNTMNIVVNHKANNTHSEIYNHGVNVKDSKLTYNVYGIVPKNYSKCICNQDNQIINMSNGKSTICPNLCIDNFDVNSNHSAYIGKFRDEDMFYLMSRGISSKNCYKLLLRGFLINNDSIEFAKISDFLECIDKI